MCLLFVATVACAATMTSSAQTAVARALTIYFIDVEGGQSTLLVGPGKETLLIDTGYASTGTFESASGDPGSARDANRILAAAHDAGVSKIDVLLITHFHADHVGGVPELSKLIPIVTFVDHGSPAPDAEKGVSGTNAVFKAYSAIRAGKRHLEPKPGDRLPLKEMTATVVSSARETLTHALAGAGKTNPACAPQAMPAQEPTENPRSTGVVVSFGRFRFLDVGDLSGPPLFALACPTNRVGPVDAYLVAHHGGPDAADPATLAAFKPRVAIVNNGAVKGGSTETLALLAKTEGVDTWQLHRAVNAGDANTTETRIANLDERTANWIKLVAAEDGSFTVTIAGDHRQSQKEYRSVPAR
ncbi:MAG TPA: MBL fold metallo-hydrolase [Vicinamibacterales bacterium]|jgi:beta-lactamase superfamily II metal-dependent hydrolase